MKTIQQSYTIHAPLHAVWEALVDPKQIDGWGGGPVKMNDKVGTKFSLWGGSIWGRNIESVTEKKLVQEWYSEEDTAWEQPSVVTFILQPEKTGVKLHLLHTDIPDAYEESIADGWKEYYLGPLKEYVEEKAR